MLGKQTLYFPYMPINHKRLGDTSITCWHAAAAACGGAAFNKEVEEMLCYTANTSAASDVTAAMASVVGGGAGASAAAGATGALFLKTADFPVTQQKFAGTVVGFAGSKVRTVLRVEYCGEQTCMQTLV
jgi:hypothetical protein